MESLIRQLISDKIVLMHLLEPNADIEHLLWHLTVNRLLSHFLSRLQKDWLAVHFTWRC